MSRTDNSKWTSIKVKEPGVLPYEYTVVERDVEETMDIIRDVFDLDLRDSKQRDKVVIEEGNSTYVLDPIRMELGLNHTVDVIGSDRVFIACSWAIIKDFTYKINPSVDFHKKALPYLCRTDKNRKVTFEL